jgi:hypothetical protein
MVERQGDRPERGALMTAPARVGQWILVSRRRRPTRGRSTTPARVGIIEVVRGGSVAAGEARSR